MDSICYNLFLSCQIVWKVCIKHSSNINFGSIFQLLVISYTNMFTWDLSLSWVFNDILYCLNYLGQQKVLDNIWDHYTVQGSFYTLFTQPLNVCISLSCSESPGLVFYLLLSNDWATERRCTYLISFYVAKNCSYKSQTFLTKKKLMWWQILYRCTQS